MKLLGFFFSDNLSPDLMVEQLTKILDDRLATAKQKTLPYGPSYYYKPVDSRSYMVYSLTLDWRQGAGESHRAIYYQVPLGQVRKKLHGIE